MKKILERLRRRAGGDTAGRVARQILRTRGAWRLPVVLRRRLRESETRAVIGCLNADSRRTLLIVSHELSASGAPKIMAEVALACLAADWAVVIVAPQEGAYENLSDSGAVVVVHPDALGLFSPATTLAAEADVILCNTISTARVIESLPFAKVVWYLHETGLIDVFRVGHPPTSATLAKVADVWASSRLVADCVRSERPHTYVIGATVLPVASTVETGAAPVARALVLGSLETRKGQDLAVQAYRALQKDVSDALRIDFYGRALNENGFVQELLATIRDVPLLTFRGEVSPEAAVHAIGAADMVLIPSRDEPLSLVAIEAMSAGKIVVCSRACGIAAYITDGIDGYVAAEASVEAFRDTLERVMLDQSRWSHVGDAALRLYESQFTRAVFGRAVLDRFDALVSGAVARDHR